MEVLSKSTEETKELARSVARKLKKGDVLALYGDLGSGKTTFTSYLVHALGIDKRVQSPTFVLVRKYSSRDLTINHVDLYRLQSIAEVEDIGLEELLGEGAITVIEWAEKAESFLPKETIKINFKYEGENERLIHVQNLN